MFVSLNHSIQNARTKVWIACELYYPEEESTAHYITGIAEGLATEYDVEVFCNQPNYSRRSINAPRYERRNDVTIRRCFSTRLNKNRIAFRVANLLTSSASMFLAMLRRVRQRHVVLVGTNPPPLPFLAALVCKLRGARCVLMIHDVYPDALFLSGLLSAKHPLIRVLRRANQVLYATVDRISTCGRDMAEVVRSRLNGTPESNVVVIPNWADVDDVCPSSREENVLLRDLGLQDRFVVQFAGNIGRVQGVETLFEVARRLAVVDRTVHFLVVGHGAKLGWFESAVAQAHLSNVTLIGYRPRDEQSTFLNACDVAVTGLVRGMRGIGVPGRMYNVFASGRPLIAAVDPESEIGLVIREEDAGWVVAPDDPAALTAAILEAKADPALRRAKGTRARAAAEKYARGPVLEAYRSLIRELTD